MCGHRGCRNIKNVAVYYATKMLDSKALIDKVLEDPDAGYIMWLQEQGKLDEKFLCSEYAERREWLVRNARRVKEDNKMGTTNFQLGPYADIDPKKIPVMRIGWEEYDHKRQAEPSRKEREAYYAKLLRQIRKE